MFWRAPESHGQEGWKLQQHELTGHWRLLDPANIRRAWGSRSACVAEYTRLVIDRPADDRTTSVAPEVNLPFPTLGGKQVWMDRRVRYQWRIQTNVLTGHSRLLDPWDVRRGWGTFEAMEREWTRLVEPVITEREERDGAPERIIVMVNGIVRSKDTWTLNIFDIEREAKKRGRTVEAWGLNYPSTRVPIDDAAEWLEEAIQALPPDIPVVFVCHSMGGMVVNTYLGRRGHRASVGPHQIEQIVYLGTPFAGSPIADDWRESPLYEAVYGPAGQQLVTSPQHLQQFDWPDCPTTCVAGSKAPDGFNKRIEGDDDGTVPLSSALPEQATRHLKVGALHSFLMYTDIGRGAILEAAFPGPSAANSVPTDAGGS